MTFVPESPVHFRSAVPDSGNVFAPDVITTPFRFHSFFSFAKLASIFF